MNTLFPWEKPIDLNYEERKQSIAHTLYSLSQERNMSPSEITFQIFAKFVTFITAYPSDRVIEIVGKYKRTRTDLEKATVEIMKEIDLISSYGR